MNYGSMLITMTMIGFKRDVKNGKLKVVGFAHSVASLSLCLLRQNLLCQQMIVQVMLDLSS